MATVKLRKNTWYAVWYENGRHIMKTTNIKAKGEKEKKLAQNAADALEQAAKGNITMTQAIGAMKKIACTLGLQKKLPSVQEYLTSYRPTGSESHISNIKRAIKSFLKFLDSDAYLPLDLLTAKHCRDFIESLFNKLSIGTIRTCRSHLYTAFQIALEDEMIERNPFALVSMKRLSHNAKNTSLQRQPFTMQEIRTIIAKSVYPWKHIVILCILTGGQRLGDIACMKWSQVKWEEGVIVIRTMKTGKVIASPITNSIKRLLWPLYSKHEEYVFPESAARYMRSKGSLSCEFVAMLKGMGIVTESNIHISVSKREMSNKSFHSLRHSVVSMLRINPSFTSDLIRETVGHDSEAVERGYFSPSIEAKRSVIDFLAQQISPTA